MWLGDTFKVVAVRVGVVSLHFAGWRVLVLQDCLYILNVIRNLTSISILACNGFSTIFIKILFLLNMMLMRSVMKF